jgi:very-short-patch-repair endonuclease
MDWEGLLVRGSVTRARALRANATDAEKRLGRMLRDRRLGGARKNARREALGR